MVKAIGARTTVHFSPKSLGLNARFLGLYSDSPGMDFEAVFRQSEIEIPVLFSGSP